MREARLQPLTQLLTSENVLPNRAFVREPQERELRQRRSSEPTIEDVAREAGVSRATVSRVLGEYGYASVAARQQVLDAVTRIGYRPNTLARSMITGSTQTIGLVVADIENPFFARAARGVSDVTKAAGFEVIVANSDEDPDRERAAVQVLLGKRVDGMIVAPASRTGAEAAHLTEVTERGTPLVLFDRGVHGVQADTVVIDNVGAAREAIRHLVRLGHRRVAIVTEADSGPPELDDGRWRDLVRRVRDRPEVYPTGAGRLAGYLEALEEAGIEVEPNLIRFAGYDRGSAADETIRLLTPTEPPSAVFATDNVMTLGAFEGIQRLGRRAPRDVSIVGFDDLEWTSIVSPPLTVVAQPVHDMGRKAGRVLLGRIHGNEAPPQTHALETKLVERASTGRASA
jgi:LacI family transcriptional regulator